MSLFEDAARDLEQRKAQYNNSRRPSRSTSNRMTWLKVTEEPTAVVILSPLEWWYSHFVPALKRSRRCPGESCSMCKEGASVQLRFVLAVQCEDGQVKLLELRERHKEILDLLNQDPKGQVGCKVTVFKAWRAKNAPVLLELLGRTTVVPIELSRLVRTLGLEPLRS